MAVQNIIKEVGAAGLIGDAMNIWGFTSDYKMAREQGNNKAVSVAKGAGSFVWGEMVFGAAKSIKGGGALMAAYMGAQIGAGLFNAASEHTTKTMSQAYNQRGKLGSGYFNMTDAGYTMRQRSLNAIRQNGLNTQSVLGNEARNFYAQRV